MKDLLRHAKSFIRPLIEKGRLIASAATITASVVLSACVSVLAAPVQNLTPAARVSFTFDDGLLSVIEKALPALDGLPGTAYIVTDCIGMTSVPNDCAADGTKPYMTWDQVRQLQESGWEIGSHTVSHPYLASDGGGDQGRILGPTEVYNELAGSRAALIEQGIAVANVAFPYGDYNSAVLAEAAKWYESARGFADTDVLNSWPYNNSLLTTQQVQSGSPAPVWSLCPDMSVAGVKACIDDAIENSQWLVLTFHDISDNPGTSEESYDYKTSDLAEIAAYVKAKQEANLIKAVTIANGVVRGTNMLPNGDFSAGLSGWTTDDEESISADNGANGRYPDPEHAVSLKSGAAPEGDKHLYSPQVNVVFGQTYLIRNYVNMLGGGSINFAIDEYNADGEWISWVDPNVGHAFNPAANAINVKDIGFTYTPSSPDVAKAALQVIVRGANVNAYYDGVEWLWTGEGTPIDGDVNDDGRVDDFDLDFVLRNWQLTGRPRSEGDLNGDAVIDEFDLDLVLRNWSDVQ